MKTCEPLFVKSAFLIPSILLYAAGDTREVALELFWLALPDDVPTLSIAACPRHQTRQVSLSATGGHQGCPHGQRCGGGGKTTRTPPQSPHLKLQGEPGHYDAPQKVLSFPSSDVL
jgi:hypothetical protein